MTAMNTLETARDALALIAGVASCKVGLEPNISPADYPLIRVVPSRLTPGKPYGARTIETLVYFGAQTAKSEGLETVYEDLFTMEQAIISEIQSLGGRYIETITDEDRLDAYKLMTIRANMPDPADEYVKCSMFASSVPLSLTATPAAIKPFGTLLLESAAADWTPNLANGATARLLNGATSTRTLVTAAGDVTGPVGASAFVGIYVGGVLIGNRTAITCTGEPVSFVVQATHTATGSASFDVRASGDEEDFTFSDVSLIAQKA